MRGWEVNWKRKALSECKRKVALIVTENRHFFRACTPATACCYFWFATLRMFTVAWMTNILREVERAWDRLQVDDPSIEHIGNDTPQQYRIGMRRAAFEFAIRVPYSRMVRECSVLPAPERRRNLAINWHFYAQEQWGVNHPPAGQPLRECRSCRDDIERIFPIVLHCN